MYWFQVPENMYEVNFVLAWGLSIALLWVLTRSLFLSVLPPLLISFGDAATGVVRNTLFSDAIVISIVVALLTYVMLWRMVHGYELRVAGSNPSAASYAGISVGRTMMMAFLMGGVFSGLAGALMLMSYYPQYAISSTLANVSNRGFDGIGVALVGRNHPLGIILSAVFFGVLEAGARSMQIFARVPLEMVKVVEGIIVIAVAMPGLYSMYQTYRRMHGEVGENGG